MYRTTHTAHDALHYPPSTTHVPRMHHTYTLALHITHPYLSPPAPHINHMPCTHTPHTSTKCDYPADQLSTGSHRPNPLIQLPEAMVLGPDKPGSNLGSAAFCSQDAGQKIKSCCVIVSSCVKGMAVAISGQEYGEPEAALGLAGPDSITTGRGCSMASALRTGGGWQARLQTCPRLPRSFVSLRDKGSFPVAEATRALILSPQP